MLGKSFLTSKDAVNHAWQVSWRIMTMDGFIGLPSSGMLHRMLQTQLVHEYIRNKSSVFSSEYAIWIWCIQDGGKKGSNVQ